MLAVPLSSKIGFVRARALACVALLAPLALIVYGACGTCAFGDQCFHACVDADDCDEGLICALLDPERVGLSKPGERGSPTRCTLPCTRDADCAACADCACNCAYSEGDGFCQVGRQFRDFQTGLDPAACRLDFAPLAACEAGCACVCDHDDCGGGVVLDACVAMCIGEYDAFPKCGSVLDDYYFCVLRKGRCVFDPQAQKGFVFDPPLADACQPETAAVGACKAAN